MLSMLFQLSVLPVINHFDFGEEPINSGEMAVVNCAVTKGDLPVKITWQLNGLSIRSIQGVSIANTNKRVSQLSIDDVQAHHAGTYECIAQNKAGNTTFIADLHVNGI